MYNLSILNGGRQNEATIDYIEHPYFAVIHAIPLFNSKALLLQWKPRDATENFDT